MGSTKILALKTQIISEIANVTKTTSFKDWLNAEQVSTTGNYTEYKKVDTNTETTSAKAADNNSAFAAPQYAEIYYYHSDHLGTGTFLSDFEGNPYQFFLNLPFGETMAEQHSYTGEYTNRYKFNGKELDEETGFYYYGARYYNPKFSIWLSTDPLAEKFPSHSPYSFCYNNPLRFVDPDGRESDDVIIQGKNGNEIRIVTAGKDEYYNVPIDIKENRTIDIGLKYLDSQRFAVGYSAEASADIKAIAGVEQSASVSSVMYNNKDYGNYNYYYAGVETKAKAGAQAGSSLNIGANFFIMYNSAKNPDYNPEGFSGLTKSVGVSQDVKDVVGAGWNLSGFSSGDWKGISFGVSIGVGASANFGSVHYGQSNSVLLNNVEKTQNRSFVDRILNSNASTAIPQAIYQYFTK